MWHGLTKHRVPDKDHILHKLKTLVVESTEKAFKKTLEYLQKYECWTTIGSYIKVD